MSFQIALSNVLLTIFYLIPGYIIAKMKKATVDHLGGLSAILIYICGPFMIINAFLNMEFSVESSIHMIMFFAITFVLQASFMAIVYFVFNKRLPDMKRRILTVASVLGNVGFFGLPIIRALLPENPEAACYSTMFVFSMNILSFTVGVFCVTGDASSMTPKAAIFNPTMLGFAIALPMYVIGAKSFLPETLTNGIALLGNMTTPLCMFILGIRLTTIPLKELFSQPFVYVVCAGKLIVYPLFCFACTVFLPIPQDMKASVLVLASAPCASIILNLAEMLHGETQLSANCLLISTLVCFITIPFLTLLVL